MYLKGTGAYLDSFQYLSHCHCKAFLHRMDPDMTMLFWYEYPFHKWQSMVTNFPTTLLHRLKVQN